MREGFNILTKKVNYTRKAEYYKCRHFDRFILCAITIIINSLSPTLLLQQLGKDFPFLVLLSTALIQTRPETNYVVNPPWYRTTKVSFA